MNQPKLVASALRRGVVALVRTRTGSKTRDPQVSRSFPTKIIFAVATLLILHCNFTLFALDLSNASVYSPLSLSARETKAVQMLIEEVEKRSRITLPQVTAWPTSASPVIVVGDRRTFESPVPDTAGAKSASLGQSEGFDIHLSITPTNAALYVLGNDERGVLFGIGRLLRELHLRRDHIEVADNLQIATSPKYALRGHQLGFRPKCNSYDAWDLPVWEQYYRDLAVFGCNAIELIPPRSDDDADSPHFPRPPMEMMIGMSRLADSYGLDVWIWYPAMDKDYSDRATVDLALQEWATVFSKLPRIDAIFVPGGDPGHTQPKYLLALLEKQAANLHRFHPKAQMWVSPQSFNQAWLDEFLKILNQEKPAWLSGVVYGPQVRIPLAKLRELIPSQYPIRHYPDITHSRQCQYPVPEWDTAYAITEARECINPRPVDEAAIFRKTQPGTIGFISYSEGCNDDVNKVVWSALAWDPETEVTRILEQYGRYFIGDTKAKDFAKGLLALERNWRGPLLTNSTVDDTLRHFQALEKSASPQELRNWRFQQALLRAYYDSSVQHRLVQETKTETEALNALRQARTTGSLTAISASEKILVRPNIDPALEAWHTRLSELGSALFQSIGMQLSVEKYQAIAIDRGACLDTLGYPLNNRIWLNHRFAAIRTLPSEPERLNALHEIVNWTDPGPGGYYDDLGNVALQPHLVVPFRFNEDPERMRSPRVDFEEDLVVDSPDESAGAPRRVAWMDHVESLYDAPLEMHYSGLDPNAHYKLKVVYGGDNLKRQVRLVANKTTEIHPFIQRPVPFSPLEFSIPASTTDHGELTLTWLGEPGLGGNGRSCQVSEVWLIKEPSAKNPK